MAEGTRIGTRRTGSGLRVENRRQILTRKRSLPA